MRSDGKGDNLFVCSIVALDAETGRYKWHYQFNPGETWDYNAVMDMQIADLAIDDRPRQVIMTAPKNGFFYVIDRISGKLISAEPFAKVTWASKIDLATGEVMLMSAGHEHPLLVRADGSVSTHELDGGPPFCIVDFPYPDEPMKLAPGETLVLISDGVSEALNAKSELFGHARLLAALEGKTSATAMIESLRDAVRAFENGIDATDDLTVMAVRYLGSAPPA